MRALKAHYPSLAPPKLGVTWTASADSASLSTSFRPTRGVDVPTCGTTWMGADGRPARSRVCRARHGGENGASSVALEHHCPKYTVAQNFLSG